MLRSRKVGHHGYIHKSKALNYLETLMRQHEVNETTKSLVAYFTKRDVALYALGIGCCHNGNADDDVEENNGHDERELRYVYERHAEFEVFPLYLLALFFIAEKRRENRSIHQFN